jgi:hypothetical protein
MSRAVRMGAFRGDIGVASVGDAGNGGTGGVVFAIRFGGADASVFERSRVGFSILPMNALVFCRTEDFEFFTLQSSGPELVGTRSTPLDGPVDGPGFCSLPFCTVVGVVAGMVCPEDEVEDL